MPGRSTIITSEQERSALRLLARSARRGEADRAGATLLTLAGRHAGESPPAWGCTSAPRAKGADASFVAVRRSSGTASHSAAPTGPAPRP
jgi:hypothetical protein